MSGFGGGTDTDGVTAHLKAVVRAGDEFRVRAIWRVLLAMPVFWVLAGGLAGGLQAAVPVVPQGGEPGGGLAQSLLHALLVAVALVGWARYLDRWPLSSYGISASVSWIGSLLVGFVAVVAAQGLWYGFGSVVGWASLAVSMTAPRGSMALWMGVAFVTLLLHAAVQQLVFFRVILGSAAEGLHGRGLATSRAILGGLLVGVALYVAMHQLSSPIRILDLAVAGTLFGLLYVHTGDVAVSTGAHTGMLYGGTLFTPASMPGENLSVLTVTQSPPAGLDALRQGFPKLAVGYLLLVAYLQWRRGAVEIGIGPATWASDS